MIFTTLISIGGRFAFCSQATSSTQVDDTAGRVDQSNYRPL